MNHPRQPRAPSSPAEILAHAPPGAVVHHTSYAMHQMTITQPSGAKFAWWAACWTWATNQARDLPPVAHVPIVAPLDLSDVQPHLLFDPSIVTNARLPWEAGQPPPAALLPPGQQHRPALPWWRRLGGPGR